MSADDRGDKVIILGIIFHASSQYRPDLRGLSTKPLPFPQTDLLKLAYKNWEVFDKPIYRITFGSG